MPISLVDPVRQFVRRHASLKRVPVLTTFAVVFTICGWEYGRAGSTEEVESIDVLHYDLALTLGMTDGFLGERMTMQVRISSAAGGATDRIPVHSAQLDIDSAFVNGTRCTVERDSVNEKVTIVHPAGHLFMPGESLTLQIDYRRMPDVSRPGSRWVYYFFLDTLGIPSNLSYTMSEPSDARFWMPCHDEP